MATALRSKSFQKNLFFSIGGIFLLFAVCFSVYQYQREKDYKIDILHSRLQMYNYELMQSLGEQGILCDSLFEAYTQSHNIDRMRMTIIDTNGLVLQDNNYQEIDSLPNHLKRVEVQEALANGNGYDIKRTSESTHETYFYSATRFGDLVIRSAVPYSAELTESLKADNTYIYFTIALTLLLAFALYLNTRRISRHIGHLREFAVKAEEGEELDHELERHLPDDELGEISHTIITLYWKLRHSEEDKLRIKRQLTQNAAHELKTPAASIHGFLESILDNPDMPQDKRQHFLERCYAQSERMSKLLMDMSQLTRLDEMPTSLSLNAQNNNTIDIVPIIHNVLEDTALQLRDKGIEPIVELPESIIVSSPFAEPESFIYSVFRNLVDNALAYATGATKLLITYNNGEFSVSDNGVGVSPQHLPYLFERFYRVDKGRSRKLGGTGLGLAIVKNTVAAHGGTITALPTPGGGLTIKFTL
jgi:signal transduction histidine kinase